MDCRKRENQISMLLDGELESSASDELLAHVATCKACRSLHERIIALNADMEALAQVSTIPSDLATKVKERISAVKEQRIQPPSYSCLATGSYRSDYSAVGHRHREFGRAFRQRILLPERIDSAMEVRSARHRRVSGGLIDGCCPGGEQPMKRAVFLTIFIFSIVLNLAVAATLAWHFLGARLGSSDLPAVESI